MEAVAIAIAGIIFNKFLEKSGEKLAEAFAKQSGEAIAQIATRHPQTAKALESSDPQVITAELVETVQQQAKGDPRLQSLLAEVAKLTQAQLTPEALAQLQAVQTAEQTAQAIHHLNLTTYKQIGLEDIEAEELEAKIDQAQPANPNTNVEQTGAKGVKVKGKAVFKITQN